MLSEEHEARKASHVGTVIKQLEAIIKTTGNSEMFYDNHELMEELAYIHTTVERSLESLIAVQYSQS